MARDLLTKEFLTVQQSDPVAGVIGRLDDQTTACVMDGDRFVGLFSPHQLITSLIDTSELKVGNVTEHVPALTLADDHLRIASVFYDAGMPLLPVLDKEKLVGVVHIWKVLGAIAHQLKEVRVEDIRHPAPLVVLEHERIDTAFNIMHEAHAEHLAVLSPEGKLSGVLGYKELLQNYYVHNVERDMGQRPVSRTRAYRADPKGIQTLPVSDFMSTEFFTVADEASAAYAAQQMVEHKASALFILDDGMPTSIVTYRELLETMIHAGVPENMNIQYIGLEELDIDTYQKMHIKRIVSRHAEKLDRYFNNEFQLTVHLKEYARDGAKHKYSVHLRVAYPGAVVPSSQAYAWNARTAIQQGFKRLTSELEHWHKQNQRELFSERTASVQGVAARKSRFRQ